MRESGSVLGLTLLLVRHGVTMWNAEGRLQGQTDVPLSDAGREQARRLGARLVASWESGALPGPPRAVYSSDLSRAWETAELVLGSASSLPFHRLPSLRERGFGPFEGLTANEARARFGPDVSHNDDGEPYAAVWERMMDALGQMWDEHAVAAPGNGSALVVGHGGSLRLLLCRAAGLGPGDVRRFHLDNTGLSVVSFRGPTLAQSEGRVLLANDTAHLFYSGATA